MDNQVINPYIPMDSSKQQFSSNIVKRFINADSALTVVDLGCGAGNSYDMFRGISDKIQWIGIDIEESPEVASRQRTDAAFISFDGINIPLDDNSCEIIFCNQVLEHVRNPRPLLAEIERVLKPGGVFVGSTSQLEPYHSFSFWNFTPAGLVELMLEAQLLPVEISPSIDGPSLIFRSLLPQSLKKFTNCWWTGESPFNRMISLAGKLIRKEHMNINRTKLKYAGQFCFVAHKC